MAAMSQLDLNALLGSIGSTDPTNYGGYRGATQSPAPSMLPTLLAAMGVGQAIPRAVRSRGRTIPQDTMNVAVPLILMSMLRGGG